VGPGLAVALEGQVASPADAAAADHEKYGPKFSLHFPIFPGTSSVFSLTEKVKSFAKQMRQREREKSGGDAFFPFF